MRALLTRTLYLSVQLLTGALLILLSASTAQAQGGTTGPFDIGPRNPGTQPANNVCGGLTSPLKFPAVSCVDVDQPPAPPQNPPAAGAGNVVGPGPLAGMWFQSINVFEAVASVQGSAGVSSEPIVGLGPAFNSNSCVSCHSAPAVGGTSPGSVSILTGPNTHTVFNMPLVPEFQGNPELAAAGDQGGSNLNPTFPSGSSFTGLGFQDVPVNGPVIEVRIINGLAASGNSFAVQPNGVGELFTIQGRGDASGCTISQLDFGALGPKSIAFRIPTPTFGLGLVEATPDATLLANSPPGQTTTLGVVEGNFNRNGNDGTITRFGWKAQNKSLLIFAGEASNVEMGVTNELFPNEKTTASGANCPTNTSPAGNQPEDEILLTTFPANTGAANIASVTSSNAQNNAVFMRMNGAPSQCDAFIGLTQNPYGTTGPAVCEPLGTNVLNGQSLFNQIGCNQCHTPTLVSGLSQNSSLSNQTFHPYSDFALHTMGDGDADGITQGAAGSDQFRTAPLWGLGQRIFFFHDGRATDLLNAIKDHCLSSASTSEACGSVNNFSNLTDAQQQNIIYFLRSL